jgi:hypothetical protein
MRSKIKLTLYGCRTALSEIKNGKVGNVPNHLKDSNLDGKELEHG